MPAHDTQDVLDEVEELRRALRRRETEAFDDLRHVPPPQLESARNLVHYLAMRDRDVRPLQEKLERMGLSSLGRSEAHVMGTLDSLVGPLRALVSGDEVEGAPTGHLSIDDGRALLHAHAVELLGPHPSHRDTAIMVTLPSRASTDPELVAGIVEAGADIVRINCAHDDEQAWEGMVRNVARAAEARGRRVRVLMDLAGPKLRTGPLPPGPQVMKFRPERDAFGRVTQPAVISFRRDDIEGSKHDGGDFRLSIDPWPLVDEQDRFHLEDARGRRRRLRVRRSEPGGFEAELSRTAYLGEGQAIIGSDGVRRRLRGIPAIEPAIHLQVGDELILTAELEPDESEGDTPRIGCTLPEAFEQLGEGHRVVFDDGKIVAVVREVDGGRARLEIVRTRKAGGAKLGSAKGINLPDTEIPVAPLTPEDQRALAFIASHADVVGLSFVRGPNDVHALLGELDALGASHVPVVAKIETVEAFRALPQILLALLTADRAGVMIARGDLAVESGYERLAELQEEILWLCEAAHLPSIWATQVLEGLTKTGTPSRAEVTDAAMASRAECVMLNKGEFITQAVSTLDDILARMTGHQSKKGSRLRRLRSWYED